MRDQSDLDVVVAVVNDRRVQVFGERFGGVGIVLAPVVRRHAERPYDLVYQASLGFTTNDAAALDDVLTFTQVAAKAQPFIRQAVRLTNVPA